MAHRDRIVWCLLIFGFALALRAWHLWELDGTPVLDLLMGDAASYDAWARRIAAGDWLGSEVFYQAPLYPYFLAVLYSAISEEVVAVRWVQAALGAGSCVLLALAGWRFFSRAAGIAAGLLLAVYAPAIFADTTIQKSVLVLFCLNLSLWLLSGAVDRPTPRRCLLLGAATGMLVLARENALIFAAVLGPWLLWRTPERKAARLVPAALFAVGLAAALLPVALRNAYVGGEFHLTTSQLGPNLFIGNNAAAEGTYRPLLPGRGDAKYEREDARRVAEAATRRSLSPAEVSEFFVDQVVAYVRSEPAAWGRLMARKLALAANAVEVVDTVDPYTHAEGSAPMRVATWVFHFGLLAPLAMLGVFVSWRERSRLFPLYALFVAYGASLLAFYVFGRYRLPLVPFLALFAATAVVGFRDFAASRSRGTLVAALTTTAGFAVLCNWPLLDPHYMRSITHYNLGNELYTLGDHDAAVAQYRKAILLREDNAQAVHNLGFALGAQGDAIAAREHYERALQLSPHYADARFNLAQNLWESGDRPGAIENYERGLAIDATRADAYAALGRLYRESGQLGLAVACLERAKRADPALPGVSQLLDRLKHERNQLGADDATSGASTACRVGGAG